MRKIISVLFGLAGLVHCAWAGSVTLTTPEQGESAKHKLIRRLVGAAACGLSAMDGVQSAQHIGTAGIVEGNPALSNQGQLRTGRMIGLKIGMCAAPLAIGEFGAARRNKALEELGLWTGIGSAGVSAAVIAHNHSVLGQTK
ncbi:MAG: hypothetical protein ACRD5L_12975 [Bryobacteraceae bacterium]